MSNIHLTDLRELRVGNIVTASYPPQWEESGLINEHEITPEDFADKNVSFYGISITEEWLERFGFKLSEYRDSNWFHYDHALLNDFIYDLNNKCFRSYYEGLQTSKICNGVHDLQNCFYFLTGTELTLKQ